MADLDVEQIAGLSGAAARVSLLHNNRGILSSDLVGDIQTVSNMDTPIGVLRLYEAWIETVTGCGAVRAGLLNLNEEFDTNPIGALFTNSLHGIGPDLSPGRPERPGHISCVRPGRADRGFPVRDAAGQARGC